MQRHINRKHSCFKIDEKRQKSQSKKDKKQSHCGCGGVMNNRNLSRH